MAIKIKDMFRYRNRREAGKNAWLLAAVIALGGLVYFLNRPVKDRIPWFTEFDQARMAASTQNKLIMLYFTASWCPPCRQMARSTWSDDRVEQVVTRSYVPVKVDLSNKNDHSSHHLAVQYDTFVLPTVILADQQGTPIQFQEGFVPADELVRLLELALRMSMNTQSNEKIGTPQTELH